MVKLFAWEPFILKKLSDAREVELIKLRNTRLLDIANSLVSEFLPLVVKIIVFAIYVSFRSHSVSCQDVVSQTLLDTSYEEGTHW